MNLLSTNKWALGLWLFLVPCTYLHADSKSLYDCHVINERIRLSKGRVSLSFTIDLGEQPIGRQHRRVITPVIRTADYSRSIELSPVVVTGRNRAIKDRRSARTSATPEKVYIGMTGRKDRKLYVEYVAEVEHSRWMDEAELVLRDEVEGCACGGLMDSEQVVTATLLYNPRPVLSAERECPEVYDMRTKSCDAFLIYPVDQTTLLPHRYGNRQELAKIDSVLTAVSRNPAYAISRIDIAGFASPEGGVRHNMKLSEGRSQALVAYICRRYEIADSLMTVVPGGENWQGLAEILKQIELPYKDEIQKAIESTGDPDRREDAIKAIGGGMPYRMLLATVYPMLRKNTFRVSYYSRERTLEEALHLVSANPEELNVYEFYKVAQAYYADNAEQRDHVLTIAADSHPAHSIANYNAAVIALRHHRPDRAERYLLRTANEPYTWNTRGCLLWQQGKEEEAIVWWEKAAANGDHEAATNLAEVEKRGR